MSKLSLETKDQIRSFEPGTSIEVDAAWELDAPPRGIELRVVWNTGRHGTLDFKIVDTVSLDASQSEQKRIPLTLPRGPYSFEGIYVALEWALELVVFPSQDSARLPITIGPGGKQVSITHSRSRELSSNIFDWLFTGRWPSWDELD
jgi:hypothetical protein